ncbi:hypothetical protein [Undibacterium sp. Ren11W]|uniref:hypothetical protein n=1 Tax=Undibacterium sp. Ren11W TaxID=3413045 RepID=UPI003BEFBE11
MRYPNQRYADIDHLIYYASDWKIKALAKHLKRDERTIKDWLSGAKKCPWWVPEILRLERLEKYRELQQMRAEPTLAKLGIFRGDLLHFPNNYDVKARKAAKLKQNDCGKGFIKEQNELILKQYRK